MRKRLVLGIFVFAVGLSLVCGGILFFVYEIKKQKAVDAYNAGQVIDARFTLESISKFPLNDPAFFYNFGMIYLWGESPENAKAQFRRVISESKDSKLQAQAYYLLAWIEVKRIFSEDITPDVLVDSYRKTLMYLEKALDLDPDHKDAKNLYERIVHLVRLAPSTSGLQPVPINKMPSTDPGEPKP